MTALKPAEATRSINSCAKSDDLEIQMTQHAKERLLERDLLMSDLLFLLRNGFVYDEAQASTRPNFFKYNVQSPTPNTNGRALVATVIPDECCIKVVTIMWKDE